MILVTGAAGKSGRAIIERLAGREVEVRALVRRPQQMELVQKVGASSAVAGDMRLADTWEQAMAGVRAVYHICPNVHPDELGIGRMALQAAAAAQIEHFVYHSVLHPQIEAMPHHWYKMRVEELLFTVGIPFTILQPAAYMQNLLGGWQRIREQGIYSAPYPADTRLSLVDLADVAEAAAVVLTEPGHKDAIYELAGPQPLRQDEIAAMLGRALGRQVQFEQTPLEAWRRQAQASGMGAYQVETLLKMFIYYEQHGFTGSSGVLAHLLGRAAGTLDRFLEQAAAETSP